MVFTIVSIVLSGFQHLFRYQSKQFATIMIASFIVESNHLANMREREFLYQVVFRQKKIRQLMYKLLHINPMQVERLIPLQLSNGARFTFLVEVEDDTQFESMKKEFTTLCQLKI